MDIPQEIGKLITEELKLFTVQINELSFSISLEQKLNIWDNYFSKIENLRISMDFLKVSESEIEKFGLILVNQFSEYFFNDIVQLKIKFDKNNFSNDTLEIIFSKIFKPIFDRHFEIKNTYNLNLKIQNNSEISTLTWGLNKTLEELNVRINEKIRLIEGSKKYNYTIDKNSEKAFNLGFLALNKNATFSIPKGSVFKSKSDFKRFYFPTFNQNNTEVIFCIKKLFQLSTYFDSKNISAQILCLIAEIEFYRSMQEEVPIKLLNGLISIYDDNSSNGFAAIELAYAYATFENFEKSREYINLALTQSDNSVYIYYRAANIFINYSYHFNCSQNEIINLLQKALQIDPENHLINYEIARYYLINDEIAKASLYINNATFDSNNLLNRDILTLKSKIHNLMPSFAFKPGYYEEIKVENSILEYAIDSSEMLLTNKYVFTTFERIEFTDGSDVVNIFRKNQKYSDFAATYSFKNIVFFDLQFIANRESLNFLNIKFFSNGLYYISEESLILKNLNFLEFFN